MISRKDPFQSRFFEMGILPLSLLRFRDIMSAERVLRCDQVLVPDDVLLGQAF